MLSQLHVIPVDAITRKTPVSMSDVPKLRVFPHYLSTQEWSIANIIITVQLKTRAFISENASIFHLSDQSNTWFCLSFVVMIPFGDMKWMNPIIKKHPITRLINSLGYKTPRKNGNPHDILSYKRLKIKIWTLNLSDF